LGGKKHIGSLRNTGCIKKTRKFNTFISFRL